MRIIPREKMEAYQPPAEKYPRVKNHYDEWVEACKAGKQSGCNFAYAGPLSEMVLLGNIAIRTGKKIYWDAEKREITNVPEANDYLHYEYREGWSL